MKGWFIRFTNWFFPKEKRDMHLLATIIAMFWTAAVMLGFDVYELVTGTLDEEYIPFLPSIVFASFGAIALVAFCLPSWETPADEDEPPTPTTFE